MICSGTFSEEGTSHDLENWQAEATEACLRRQYARLINGMRAELSRHLGRQSVDAKARGQVQRRLKKERELEKKAGESTDSYSAKDSYSAG